MAWGHGAQNAHYLGRDMEKWSGGQGAWEGLRMLAKDSAT